MGHHSGAREVKYYRRARRTGANLDQRGADDRLAGCFAEGVGRFGGAGDALPDILRWRNSRLGNADGANRLVCGRVRRDYYGTGRLRRVCDLSPSTIRTSDIFLIAD